METRNQAISQCLRLPPLKLLLCCVGVLFYFCNLAFSQIEPFLPESKFPMLPVIEIPIQSPESETDNDNQTSDGNSDCEPGYTQSCDEVILSIAQVNADCQCIKEEPNQCKYFTAGVRESNRANPGATMLEWSGLQSNNPSKLSCLAQIAARCNNENFELFKVTEEEAERMRNMDLNQLMDDMVHGRLVGLRDECIIANFDERILSPKNHLVFDDKCQTVKKVAENEICGNLILRYVTSPISLIWDDTIDINRSISFVKFPLEMFANNKWYIWKGSAKTPLLVYDPEQRGIINKASQLFGNWTFGGQTFAALDSFVKQRFSSRWDNGYQALSSLDANGDNEISGRELEPLALWFDYNQDGISDIGEVRPLKEVNVTALYFQLESSFRRANDIHLPRGYKREVKGEIDYGATVDWFSPGADSRHELFGLLSSQSCPKSK